jgi:hypothetical protein
MGLGGRRLHSGRCARCLAVPLSISYPTISLTNLDGRIMSLLYKKYTIYNLLRINKLHTHAIRIESRGLNNMKFLLGPSHPDIPDPVLIIGIDRLLFVRTP